MEVRSSREAVGEQAKDEERHSREEAEDQEEVDEDCFREDREAGRALQ